MDFDGELHASGGMNMPKYPDEMQGPVVKAAKMALDTGNVNYILIWLPEESENTLKNLLEKTCCKRSSRMNMQKQAYDWYFATVNRFFNTGRLRDDLTIYFGGFTEKPLDLKIHNATESGNFEEIREIIPITHQAEAKQRFLHVMNMRNHSVNNIAAGRAYVSAFIDFNWYVYDLASGLLRKEERSKKLKEWYK
jgi:hypothetical protein